MRKSEEIKNIEFEIVRKTMKRMENDRERMGVRVCVCVCVCERERERERERHTERNRQTERDKKKFQVSGDPLLRSRDPQNALV